MFNIIKQLIELNVITIDVVTMISDNETVVSGFEIENNGKIITSQLKEKETSKTRTKRCKFKWLFICYNRKNR